MSKIYYILIGAAILFLYPLCAQPGFNLLKDVGFDKNHIRDMIVVNDTIIGYGIGFDSPVNGNQGVILVMIDSSGNLLKSNIILDPLGEPLSIDKHWGKIIPTDDGGFAMTAATVGRPSAFLIKTDSELQVEFIKEYSDTVNLSNFQYSVVQAEEGFILYGAIQDTNFIYRQFIRKVDKYGETIWFTLYGNPNFNSYVSSVETINDTIFALGSYEAASLAFGGPFKSVIRIIDIGGNQLATWESEINPQIGEIIKLTCTENGSLLCFGVAVVGEISGYDIVQPTFFKLDENLLLKWVKNYGRTGLWHYQRWFRDMEPTSDGNYVAAGESHKKINGKEIPSGWLMKISTDGDSIWSRYDLPDFPIDSLGDTYFGGVGVLSSGSIVAGGTATLWNERSIWLVKVTTDGCLEVIDCGLVPTTIRPEEEGGMVVYPNPANSYLTLEINQPLAALGEWSLYNTVGGKVMTSILGKGQGQYEIDVSGLPNGLYFWEIKTHNGRLGSGKLMVSR